MEQLLRERSTTTQRRAGTRFWIFPQPPIIQGYEQPELVWLPMLPDEIRAGPSDIRMYVVEPAVDKAPYDSVLLLPPYDGPRRPPVFPGPDRHFDNIGPEDGSFLAVHAYACVNFVLGVWENLLGRRIRWFFDETFERLEIIPLVSWANAHAGYGFLELGYSVVDGIKRPFALNFDTIGHEVGHFIVLSELGLPMAVTEDADFFPYSESICDLVSLISFLHFDSVLDRLLKRTRGNLLLQNELNRIAETSPDTQIRRASNFRKMSEVSREPHDRSLPFTGAIFDAIVELYHRELIAAGIGTPTLLNAEIRDASLRDIDLFEVATATAFAAQPQIFKAALIRARDIVGLTLAESFRNLEANTLRLVDAAQAVVDAADGSTAETFRSCFAWRDLLRPELQRRTP